MLKFFAVVLLTFYSISSSNAFEINTHYVEQKKEPFVVKEFTLDGPGKLNVRTSGGSIQVTGQNNNKVRVEMFVRQNGKEVDPDNAEVKKIIEENFKIDISKSGNTITASSETKRSLNRNSISISFVTYVPEQTDTNLQTSGGSISINGLRGEQKANTSGGSINLQSINGTTKAVTSGGSINIDGYDGKLDAVTSGGSINIQKSKGELEVATSGGSINIDDVAGSLVANTSGGSIRANILTLEKSLTLQTSGGSINATIPQGLGMDLDLRGNRVNTQLTNFSGEAGKDKIVGSMNGGGVKVKMATSGGNVNLSYR